MLVRLALTLCLLCVSTYSLADNTILILTSSGSDYQKRLSSTIKSELSKEPTKSTITVTSQLDEDTISNNELVIAIGKDSITVISKKSFESAVFNAMKKSSNNTTSKTRIHESKIHMTQPLCRQFRFIKAINPDWKTVGLLLSESNETKASTLSACGKKHNLTTLTVTIESETDLVTALNTALSNSDVLLSLPNPLIYNSRTIKNILLTSYRHRVPIIGFSESFANAGAIAAVHTSAEQLGRQVAKIVRIYFENNKSLSQREYYPEYFSVTTNQQVARSLGIKIKDSQTIESDLRIMEPAIE